MAPWTHKLAMLSDETARPRQWKLWQILTVIGAFLVLLFFIMPSDLSRPSSPPAKHDPNGGGSDILEIMEGQRRVEYREIASRSSPDGSYWHISFHGLDGYNPNVIPHPTHPDVFVVVAQDRAPFDLNEISCLATFENGHLACSDPPTVLPVPPSIKGQCQGQFSALNDFPGPRDARLAYSPDLPYLTYGSQSNYICLGQWVHDLRPLIPTLFPQDPHNAASHFTQYPTEISRTQPYDRTASDALQKNFFLFWDADGNTYAQYDIAPNRSFAQLDAHGIAGPDLALTPAGPDTACLQKHLPAITDPTNESIHQSTNSLALTTCDRGTCTPSPANTFIMHIYQHKLVHRNHPVYESYVYLFARHAPFALHALATRPFWVRGRLAPGPVDRPLDAPDRNLPANQSEMLYVVSMAWKGAAQRYHGFLDDELLLSFGREDATAGVVDVRAADLLQDLAACA